MEPETEKIIEEINQKLDALIAAQGQEFIACNDLNDYLFILMLQQLARRLSSSQRAKYSDAFKVLDELIAVFEKTNPSQSLKDVKYVVWLLESALR